LKIQTAIFRLGSQLPARLPITANEQMQYSTIALTRRWKWYHTINIAGVLVMLDDGDC
jgi:hypothetical protein